MSDLRYRFIVDGHRYTFGRVPGSPNAFPTIEAAEDYEALARTLLAYEAESGLFKTTDSFFLQFYIFLNQNLGKTTAYAYHRAFNNYWLPLLKAGILFASVSHSLGKAH